MKTIPQLTALLVCLVASVSFAEEKPIPIWPGVAPGDKVDVSDDVVTEVKAGKKRITNVTRPTLTFFRPAAEKASGVTVLVFPGGGYNMLAEGIEGTRVCKWLNSIGITGVMLKYRVPRREGIEKHVAPLQDAQRAMGMLRRNAKEWKVDPAKLGVIGFSAGGHLAASLSNNFETRTYPAVDESDKESCRPDFAMLIYPFYLTTEDDGINLAPEIKITEKTPPAFIVMTQDDRVNYAYAYALGMKRAKVSAELHVYPTGGHGYGLGNERGAVGAWPGLAETWMRVAGWLPAK